MKLQSRQQDKTLTLMLNEAGHQELARKFQLYCLIRISKETIMSNTNKTMGIDVTKY